MKKEYNPHVNHRKRLRDRFSREGADAFHPHELLELFLFDALPRVNTNTIAHALIDRFGSLEGVLTADVRELTKVKGIGIKTAEYIKKAYIDEMREMEEIFRRSPMVSFERASNYLISHMKTAKTDICHVFTDENHFVLDVSDGSPGIPDGAAGVIIGVKSDTVPLRTEEFERRGITVTDVIKVEGYDAVSIKKETK